VSDLSLEIDGINLSGDMAYWLGRGEVTFMDFALTVQEGGFIAAVGFVQDRINTRTPQ